MTLVSLTSEFEWCLGTLCSFQLENFKIFETDVTPVPVVLVGLIVYRRQLVLSTKNHQINPSNPSTYPMSHISLRY